jgi:hypothetical protein
VNKCYWFSTGCGILKSIPQVTLSFPRVFHRVFHRNRLVFHRLSLSPARAVQKNYFFWNGLMQAILDLHYSKFLAYDAGISKLL